MALLQEMCNKFDATTRQWKDTKWMCKERSSETSDRPESVWPPAKFKVEPEQDDGLKDIDKFVIPEDVPEVDVFLEMYDVIVGLRDKRPDLTPEQVFKAALVLVMNVPTFRYILRPAELLETEPEPLRVKADQPPIYV